jgi:hypothetical protein
MIIHHQKSDVNAIHFIKNLNHVDLNFHISCLFERSFNDVEIDDYDYDDT